MDNDIKARRTMYGGSVELSSSLHLLFMRLVDGFAPINSLCRHRTCHVALAMKVENQMYVPCTLSSWPNYRRRETQTRWAGFGNMIEIFPFQSVELTLSI